MGRAYIAASPPDEKAALLEGIERRTDPSLWPSIHAGFARAEEEIATRGFYGNIGEWQPGVNAVAVPFQSKQGNTPLMAFNLGGPASYLPKDEMLGTYGPRLVNGGNPAAECDLTPASCLCYVAPDCAQNRADFLEQGFASCGSTPSKHHSARAGIRQRQEGHIRRIRDPAIHR